MKTLLYILLVCIVISTIGISYNAIKRPIVSPIVKQNNNSQFQETQRLLDILKPDPIEQAKYDKERQEKERIKKEQQEKERIEKERIKKERIEKERIEKERIKEEQDKKRQEIELAQKRKENHIRILELKKSIYEKEYNKTIVELKDIGDIKIRELKVKELSLLSGTDFNDISETEITIEFYNRYIQEVKDTKLEDYFSISNYQKIKILELIVLRLNSEINNLELSDLAREKNRINLELTKKEKRYNRFKIYVLKNIDDWNELY